MAGFAGLIGGLGSSAQQYGQQIRSLLEQRRSHFASLLGQMAENEPDPEYRAKLHGGVADLMSNKNLHDIASKILPTLQSKVESDTALANAVGMPQSPKSQTMPATVIGMTPGTGTQQVYMGGAPAFTPANFTPSPANSPSDVSQQAPPQNPQQPQQSDSVEQLIAGHPESYWAKTPAGLRLLSPRISKQAELEEKKQYGGWEMTQKRRGLAEFQASPAAASVPPIMTAMMQYAANTPGSQMPQMSPYYTAMGRVDKEKVSASALEAQFPGTLAKFNIDPTKVRDVFITRNPYSMYNGDLTPISVTAVDPGVMQTYTPDGGIKVAPKLAGDVSGAAAPSKVRANVGLHLVTNDKGQLELRNQTELNTGNYMNQMYAPVRRTSSSTPTMEGGTVSTNTTQKIPTGGIQAVNAGSGAGSGAANNPMSGTPKMVGTFNPSSPLDNAVRLIAQDAANWKTIETKGPFGPNNPRKSMVLQRMAQLGIDPNNVSGSIRDRAAQATTILPHIGDVIRIIKEADKAGEMGVLKSLWNEFLTGKLKADPTKTQVFTRLWSNEKFLSTAAGMAHGGMRAAGSEPVMKHWEEVVYGRDPETAIAKLNVLQNWMHGYASMAGPLKEIPGVVGHSQSSTTGGLPQIGGTFNGGKVLKVEKVQ